MLQYGASLSVFRRQAMSVGADQHLVNIVVPGRRIIETVHRFPYLGSIIADDGILFYFILFLTLNHGHSGATAQLCSNVSNGQHAY